MRRRLDLAAALIGRPRALFLDEPTTGLDPRSRRELWDLMGEQAQAGATVLLTTQYMEEADRLAGQVAVLNRGRVIATGSPAELKAKVGGDHLELTVPGPQQRQAARDLLGSRTEPASAAEPQILRIALLAGGEIPIALLAELAHRGVQVSDVQVHRPTLEDVFLHLTGQPAPATPTARSGQKQPVPTRGRRPCGAAAPQVPLPGTITFRSDPHAVYAGESLTQALRQLAAFGRDGLPVLSGDGAQAAGWITNDSVLRAIAREIGTAPPQAGTPAARATDARLPDQATEPPTPLPGYQVLEITIGPGSPGVGKAIGTIAWPRGYLPVSVLHGRRLHEPHPDLVLAPGDRISLLTAAEPGNGTNPAGTASRTPTPG
jgi:TrkA-C domain/Domain of unknown function (DUF4162)/AAA domain, putative AbiEii toxin, Type IV TA system